MQEVKIEVLGFKGNLVGFELSIGGEEIVTCTAPIGHNRLQDFKNGEYIVNPANWYDMEDNAVSQPDWFKRKELFKLNNVFEEYLLCSGCS